MGAADLTSYQYWAFISYSNKDKSWARWLHRAIESYGIPTRLVSHRTPTGEPAPKRFRPIFHDRAELPASAELGAQIEEALRSSRYLIVICSPHAAQSQWVNKEIETFQSMGRSGRVLAVIVYGEPNVGGERECFPSALRHAEPIAADARSEGDGRENAKLKLLAGMLGVGFDGLKQRDTHRRIRRLQFAIVLSSVLALGFAGLSVYAQRQREKAVKARQQAEGVLQYLLFDLRNKLEPIGRLDIVKDVQERVDTYYREMGVERRDLNSLRNRAVSRDNKGDLLLARGDLAGALGEYRAARAIFEQLALAGPLNLNWRRDLFLSHDKVARVLEAQGDLGGALQEYEAAMNISELLSSADSNNTGLLRDVSWSYLNVARVHQAQGDSTLARWLCEKALRISEIVVLADSSNAVFQRDVSTAHQGLGDLLWAQGDLVGALREYRAGLTISERLLLVDSSNAVFQRDVSLFHEGVGRVLHAQGDLPGALREFQVGLAVAQRLMLSDSSNAHRQWDTSMSHWNVGDVLRAQGDLAGALREFQAGLAISQEMMLSDSGNAGWQMDACFVHQKVGDVLRAQGDLVGALREYQAGFAVTERLSSADSSDIRWQYQVMVIYLRIAGVSEEMGQGDAMAWWRKAYEQLSGMKQRGIMVPKDEELLALLKRKVGR